MGWAALVAAGPGAGAPDPRDRRRSCSALTVILAGLAQAAPAARPARSCSTPWSSRLIFGVCVGAVPGLQRRHHRRSVPAPAPALQRARRLGFGPGIGFYNEHTVASGLVNTEEQLVSLGFYLAGWPFGFSLALLLVPFLLADARDWDAAHGAAGAALRAWRTWPYFYHGIAFGPRYYFEALPSLVILTARGFAALTERVGGWLPAVGDRASRGGGRARRRRCSPWRCWPATRCTSCRVRRRSTPTSAACRVAARPWTRRSGATWRGGSRASTMPWW